MRNPQNLTVSESRLRLIASIGLVTGAVFGSLESWRTVHWAYYQRELSGTKYAPTDDMPIVCQYFEVAFP